VPSAAAAAECGSEAVAASPVPATPCSKYAPLLATPSQPAARGSSFAASPAAAAPLRAACVNSSPLQITRKGPSEAGRARSVVSSRNGSDCSTSECSTISAITSTGAPTVATRGDESDPSFDEWEAADALLRTAAEARRRRALRVAASKPASSSASRR